MVYASGALFLFAGKPYASCFPSPGSLTFRYTDTQCSKTLWLPLPWKLHQHKTNKLHDSKVIVNSLHIHCTFEKMLILNGNPLTILVKHKNVRTKAKISLYIIKHICLLSLYLPLFFICYIANSYFSTLTDVRKKGKLQYSFVSGEDITILKKKEAKENGDSMCKLLCPCIVSLLRHH